MKRILLIEDDPDVGYLVSYALKKGFGAEVVLKADGRAGLERAREGGFNLIICDLMLPGLDGLEVVRQLRQVDATAVPIIFMTAASSTAFAARSPRDLGALGVLPKPVDLRRMCQQILDMLPSAQLSSWA